MRLEHGVQRRSLPHVGANELDFLPGQLVQPLQHRELGVGEAIQDRQFVTGFGQRNANMRADVAKPAGHQQDARFRSHALHSALTPYPSTSLPGIDSPP